MDHGYLKLDFTEDDALTTEAIGKAAGCRWTRQKDPWSVDVWEALRGLPWDVVERGAEAAEAVQAPRTRVLNVPATPRRHCVTRADLGKYGLTLGCAARADIAVHGKATEPLTDECPPRFGEHMDSNLESQDRSCARRTPGTSCGRVASYVWSRHL